MAIHRENELDHFEWAEEMTSLASAGALFLRVDFGQSQIRAKLTRAKVDEQGSILLQQESVPGYPHASDFLLSIPAIERVAYKKMWDDKGGIVLTAGFLRVEKDGCCLSHCIHVSNRHEFLAAEEDAEARGPLM